MSAQRDIIMMLFKLTKMVAEKISRSMGENIDKVKLYCSPLINSD